MNQAQEKFFEDGKDITAEATAILRAHGAERVAEKLTVYITKMEGAILFTSPPVASDRFDAHVREERMFREARMEVGSGTQVQPEEVLP